MSLPIAAGTWNLDAGHTQIGFSVRHLGISTVRGIFRKFAGNAVVGADGSFALEVSAETASVDSGNEGRDGHIQGPDFFDTANHPTITVRAKSADLADAEGVVHAELTLKGITKPVDLHVKYNGSSVFPMDKSLHAGFEVTGSILRSEFNLGWGVPLVSDEVKFAFEVQLVHQAS